MISQIARNNLICSAFFAGAAAVLFAVDHSATSTQATQAVPHIEVKAPVAQPLASQVTFEQQKAIPAQSTVDRFPRQNRWVF
jgi:hypothetical protein